jgi:hypothetical protein
MRALIAFLNLPFSPIEKLHWLEISSISSSVRTIILVMTIILVRDNMTIMLVMTIILVMVIILEVIWLLCDLSGEIG